MAEIADVNTYSKEAAFKQANPFSPIQEVAGLLCALAPNNQIFSSGSCVRIAPNLYLTAKHVLTDFIDKFGMKDNELNFTVWVCHIYKGPEYAVWEIDTFWLSMHTDLAVFHVKPLNDTAGNQTIVRTVGLDLQPPTVGSRINGWGQRNSSSAISINESGSPHYDINGEGAMTVGEVREYHPSGTDIVLRPFPCCRVNARFDGGMSGGPIFLDNGKLGGIICSNLPPYDDNDEHCSFVTALWPLLAMNINIDPVTGQLVEEQYLFYELVKSGFVSVINLDKVLVTRQEETGLYNFAYVGN